MTIKTAALTAVLTTVLGFSSVQAAVTVGFDLGNVAIGYSDGYWDNGHHWHKWRNHRDAEAFRGAHADTYHEWRHDDRHHH